MNDSNIKKSDENTAVAEKKQQKILVVEDEQYMRDLYCQILKEEGYLSECTDNGETAFNKIMANDYDLILLDLILPRMSGISVLQKLRDEGKLKAGMPKIVVLTNLGQDNVIAVAVGIAIHF